VFADHLSPKNSNLHKDTKIVRIAREMADSLEAVDKNSLRFEPMVQAGNPATATCGQFTFHGTVRASMKEGNVKLPFLLKQGEGQDWPQSASSS